MSYSTPAKVKSLFRNFVEPSSDAAVTDAEIQEFLDDNFEIINSKIGTLYTLPITSGTSPQAYKVLTRIETYMTAGIVDDILNTYGEADKKPEWAKRGEEMLKALVPKRDKKGNQSEPTMKLQDATYLGTREQSNRIAVNPTSIGPKFKIGRDDW